MVTVIGGGRMVGRFGRVSKIRILAHSWNVLVFVEIYDPETGASPVMMFEPEDLEKRKFADTTAKRVERCPMKNEFILQDLAAGEVVQPLKAVA
jgi:phenylpropionate dioxygenase-like ring-hydroxylating dioxygenase large terminal subunit